jgi:hypothetical protein
MLYALNENLCLINDIKTMHIEVDVVLETGKGTGTVMYIDSTKPHNRWVVGYTSEFNLTYFHLLTETTLEIPLIL